ncbi:MAG: hypothetical protein ACE5J2_07835 [Nitrososphaerales archaeon]
MSDSDSDSADRPGKESQRRESILEVLDELIFHMNTTRNVFTLLIVSSLIIAPITLILAAVVIGHPRFLNFLMHRLPEVGIMILAFVIISIILAAIWLFIGVKERRFFSRWDKRFRRYMSLKNQIDRELEEEG